EQIADFLREQYGLLVTRIVFLPTNYEYTAAYQVFTQDTISYFLKLKRDSLDEISLTLLAFFKQRGMRHIIAPCATVRHQLWAPSDEFTAILYPFVEGQNAFKLRLAAQQWLDFGAALKEIHSARLPLDIHNRLPHEPYAPQWREKVAVLL